MSVADAALQIRGGGRRGGGRSSRPSEKGGEPSLQKNFFGLSGLILVEESRGGRSPQAPALDLPLGVMAVVSVVAVRAVVLHILHLLELLHSAADLGEGPRWPAL